jgi:hypothetical protein
VTLLSVASPPEFAVVVAASFLAADWALLRRRLLMTISPLIADGAIAAQRSRARMLNQAEN